MYISTRGKNDKISSAEAIKKGIAVDGGLFVPEIIPRIKENFIESLVKLNYQERALQILKLFLTDYTNEELQNCIAKAYGSDKFDHSHIAPLVAIDSNNHVLELWHGPTSAFKDMALQLLPQLLSTALNKTDEQKEIVILVATSGDTGKAALEGFKNVEQIKIIVFYPKQGVSQIQRLQMITQNGDNVAVVAVNGNFDDAQTGVKRIFNNKEVSKVLAAQGYQLSSANSINWGRLVPQIIYYFSAYADMVKQGRINIGQAINFVVPTGNFGNILAGYYAKLMGLPINKLICASNNNNVLTEFLRTGIYNRKRPFHKTISPSMDILISSNLERLLYHVTNGNAEQVQKWMLELNKDGQYKIDEKYLSIIQETFWADYANDEETLKMINDIYTEHNYVADPHTAVAWKVGCTYMQESGDKTPQVIVSTASPFKFNESVLTAFNGIDSLNGINEFEMLAKVSKVSKIAIPKALAELEYLPVRHNDSCDTANMFQAVQNILKN